MNAKISERLRLAATASGLLLLLVIIQLGQAQRILGDRVYDRSISNLYFTVNARYQTLELTWRNFDDPNGFIVLTKDFPISGFQRKLKHKKRSLGHLLQQLLNPLPIIMPVPPDMSFISFVPHKLMFNREIITRQTDIEWEYDARDEYGQRKKKVLFAYKPTHTNGWTKTGIFFNRDRMDLRVNITTSCYGYYAYFISEHGSIRSEYCMKLYPTWMNDLRSHLGQFRMRDLFLPGTHDSAAYIKNFIYQPMDDVPTKYTFTQDDDIRQQLLLGVRYIDLRVGYYQSDPSNQFWANHGIAKCHPLMPILRQVRDYAMETKEIIVLDVQEFPVGFGKDYTIHDKLINLLNDSLAEVMADSIYGWGQSLEKIWARNKTVIVCYDHEYGLRTYPHLLWPATEHKWGEVRSMEALKSYLFRMHKLPEYSSRPVTDMAELTPDPVGIVMDHYGGLRKMADSVNRFVTEWYFEELGPTTNIVAVDFVRGTNIVDAAIYWNLKRAFYRPKK
ncbi:PI-PLC X domain-containing protein 3-like [Sabethes cyaneus]|uniref:PI-PLC X domain-containing protein 3-like n=1 Tax=Sabethes cyaneus TaxID=53552 RepID=UPI00237D7062|nr:PI-PLC X domain-containing protein 3-like [Sabethes cyaneus]